MGDRPVLHQQVRRGALDTMLVLVHELEYVAGKQIEEVMDQKLVLIRTSQKAGPYVYVD